MVFSIEGFESEVKATIMKHKMLSKSDRVIAACSGGKDSTTALYLLKKFGYKPEALIIDLSKGEYFRRNLENLRSFCKSHGIRLHIASFHRHFGCSMCNFSAEMARKFGTKPCTSCGVLKRYMLNKKARELKADVLVFGHNLDDEAQSVLMNLLTGNTNMGLGLGPTTGTQKSGKLVRRAKPLCFTLERDIIKYSKAMGFPVIYGKCPCSAGSFRHFIRARLDEIEDSGPGIKKSILSGYIEMAPILKGIDRKLIRRCDACGEPTRNNICRACSMLKMLSAQR